MKESDLLNKTLPNEMRKLIEMMKEKSFFSGSNAEFLEIFNAYAGTEFKSNALKRMMNQWKPELEKNGVSFEPDKRHNERCIDITYAPPPHDAK